MCKGFGTKSPFLLLRGIGSEDQNLHSPAERLRATGSKPTFVRSNSLKVGVELSLLGESKKALDGGEDAL